MNFVFSYPVWETKGLASVGIDFEPLVAKAKDGKELKYTVSICSKGRGSRIIRVFDKHPFMNHPAVFVGVQYNQLHQYTEFFSKNDRVSQVLLNNDTAMGSIPKEYVRRAIFWTSRLIQTDLDFVVLTDDNCYATRESMDNLVTASYEFRRPNCMGGLHSVGKLYFRKYIDQAIAEGERSYPLFSAIMRTFPTSFYRFYQHDDQLPVWEDTHTHICGMLAGYEPRMCIDAPLNKSRHEKGGMGHDKQAKWDKAAIAVERLTQLFGTQFMSKVRRSEDRKTYSRPWSKWVAAYLGKYNEMFPDPNAGPVKNHDIFSDSSQICVLS